MKAIDKCPKSARWALATTLVAGAVCGLAGEIKRAGNAQPRPAPRPALAARLAAGPEIYGIVHWGLNTYTDKEWGFGDETPTMLNPDKFDADQIVGACKAGGIGGLIIVAKHHDGFCLWPTKTTEHNIAKTPFWKCRSENGECRIKGDYVKEMEQACRRHGLKFGVYVSPWDRNNAAYGTEKYVTDVFQKQIRELLSGNYGEIFEMWFDGANGGYGWYGGANEKRKIPAGYYRYDTETFAMVRKLQPRVCIFNEADEADFRFGGNERGIVDPDSRSTGGHYDGIWNNYKVWSSTGIVGGSTFHPIEADFPLRRGWFYHERDRGTTKCAAYLTKLYLSTVGNAATMNIGIAPDKSGRLDADDVRALAGFGVMRNALFAHEAKVGEPFNVVVMREDVSNGEQVDEWEFVADGKAVLRGKSVGWKRIRVLETPCAANNCELKVLKDGGALKGVSFKLYNADPDLVKAILSATGDDRETDTAKWMTKTGESAFLESCPAKSRLERVVHELGFLGRVVSVVETNGVCDVVYEYETGSNGFVRCELALPPAEKWNGWFKGVGNVGAAGSLNAAWVLGPAARGMAAAMTDMGSSDGRCTLNPVAIRDFGHRATHLMTVGAKQLVEAYYGREPSYSFFDGISSGGGQGIHEAQRYPADYDGIVAGVPANRRLAIAAYFRHVYRLTHDERGKLLFSPEQAAALSDAGVEYFKGNDEPYCDGRFLSEPHYTPEAASGIVELAARKCPSLAEPKLRKRAEALFADVVVDGRRVCGGFPFGAKLQAILGRDTFVMKWHFGEKWDVVRMSDSEFAAACEQLASDLNADSPDLSDFSARGGKIIMYSGIEDPIIPWSHITEYYESVARESGGFEEVQKFFAYYPMPGRSHTPDNWRNYGGRGVWTLDGLEEALHDWVSNGVFPGTLQGRYADRVTMAPVPPYPLKTIGSAAAGWSVGRYALANRQCAVARDSWHGFERMVFEFQGQEAWIVEPKTEAEGRPWAWIMEWPDAFAKRTGSIALLKAGYHVVTFRPGHYENGKFVSQPGNMNNRRLRESREFQKYLVGELHFAPKANLIGMSWGGFYSVRYAGTYPDAVSRIYLDAPLLDFSTLSGKDEAYWDMKARCYGIDIKTYEGKNDPRQPVNMYEPIAKARIPILLFYGGADTTVPPRENCIRFADAFKAAGGDIEIVARGLYGHHPHGLEVDEQQKFVDFFNGKVNGERAGR